jgi:hypothetical protein
MTDLERCNTILADLFGEKHVRIWWGTRSKAFSNVTPAEVFMVDPGRVLNHLIKITQGDTHES